MSNYLLGLATVPAVVILLLVLHSIVMWIAWWFADRDKQFWGGWGYVHDFDRFMDGRWYRAMRHTHYWPPGTPRLLVRRLEPLRVWLCEREADVRPTTR